MTAAVATGGLTISNELAIGAVVTLCTVISTLAIRFAKLNEKIVNSYFEDQKITNTTLGEVTVALREHAKSCMDNNTSTCKALSEVTKGQVQIVTAIHEHDKHMADDRRRVAELLLLKDNERAGVLSHEVQP